MMNIFLIKLIKMNIKKWILVLYLTVLIGSICIDGLSTATNERDGRKLFGGYRITPKFCRASKTLPSSDPRSYGPTICMFNHECTQRQGEVVGACMDGFLFGACCQLHGEIDTPLVDEQDVDHPQSNVAAALSYESYGNQQTYQSNGDNYNEIKLQENAMKHVHRPSTNNKYGGVIKNNVYASSSIDDDSIVNSGNIQNNDIYLSPTHEQHNGFYVENDSVVISSPSPEYSSGSAEYYPTTTPSTTAHDYYLPPSKGPSPQETFSQELPTLIPTGPYETPFTSDAFNQISQSMLTSQSADFTHSGITHPGFDSIIVEEGTYAEPISVSSERLSTTTTAYVGETTLPQKVTHPKPGFRPKPTKNNHNKYVLVQTIDHDKPTKHGSMSENDIESIESIILMLNDTKTGPQYNTDASTEPNNSGSSYYDTTYGSGSTSAIDYNKYGQSSYYITTKLPSSTPKPPSTSYLYSPEPPTRRPISVQSTIASSYGAVSPDTQSVHISATSTVKPYIEISNKKPVSITAASFATTKLPSTSYVTGSPTTKRPGVPQDEEVIVKATSHRPTTTVGKKPTKGKNPTNNKLTTRNPPATSYVTASTTLRPKTTTPKKPSTSFVYSTTQTKRPTTGTTKKGTKKPTISPILIGSSYGNSVTTEQIPSGSVVQYKPLEPLKDNSGTEIPSPTVLITPKPTVNLITSSTWTQKPNLVTKYTHPTKQPSTSYVYSPVVTFRPTGVQSTNPGYVSSNYGSSTQSYLSSPTYSVSGISASGSGAEYSSPSHRVPISSDFYDSGYYGYSSTHRPNLHQTYSTSSGYGVYENDDYNSISGSSTSYPAFLGVTQSYGSNGKHPIEYSTIHDEFYTSPNDLNNFPPVRNPNLNMSASFGTGITVDDYDISTPNFVEDQVLDDKMGLLVSKIVESLQGNFDELADVVYQEKNSTVLSDNVTKRPSATTKKPVQKATTTKRPGSNTRPGTTNARPSNTNSRPGATTINTRTTTKKPTIASQTNTRRTTTKKPTTITSRKPTATKISTTRRPTTKPTKKIVQTTTLQQDETVIEEDEEEESAEEEETTTLGEGRIQCGVRPQVKSGRIVGGKGATFGEFPWQVLVRESTWLGLFTKNKCGGVLITKNYVMTAAHCQPGFLASLVAVFGEFDISGDLETKRSVTKNVKRVVVHREYDAATFENDLALLELENPIHYDTHIVPICMPPNTADFTGRMATVTGWGRLKYGGGVPSVLQEVQVPIIENTVCQEMFHTAGHNKKILPSFLCAGYANGQKDSCEGDSGGPLVLQRSDGRWELAGTVSHGIKCAAPYLPGVYMRTTYYKPWLESVTGVH